VSVRDLWETMARYLYLPRLRGLDVLQATVGAGPATTTWQNEGFATADAFDQGTGRYLGLVTGAHPAQVRPDTLVVSPVLAAAQRTAASPNGDSRPDVAGGNGMTGLDHTRTGNGAATGAIDSVEGDGTVPRSFYGSVTLDSERLIRDFGRVSQEVIQHLTALVGADVVVTVEVQATRPNGFNDAVVRTVSENAHTLGFATHEFAPDE